MRLSSSRTQTVVITGASSGLGAELALAYATKGRVLGLVARRAEPLRQVAAECEAKGAQVDLGILDVTDTSALTQWLTALDRRSPLDLVIANAGIFDGIGNDGVLETSDETRLLIRTNLEGAILTAATAAELMRQRRAGHIALVSSLAARHPLADAPVYSATKAGLSAYGEALRERLASEGIRVSVVHPGHIATAQTARQKGPLPLQMSAPGAAATVLSRLDRRATTIAFPVRLAWLIGAGRLLPWRVRAYVSRSQRFTVGDPD